MFHALGSRTYRWRFVIVAAWVAAAILSVRFAPSIASQGSADQASFLPSSAPSVQAETAIDRAFPGSTSTSSATITFSRDTGLTDADRAYLDAFGTWVSSADAPASLRDAVTTVSSAATQPELAAMLRSPDGQLELLTVNLNVSSAGDQAEAVVSALRDHVAATAPAGLAVHVTGAAGITTDYLRAIKSGTDSTTLVTVLLVLVILLLIYRAPLAALVPLATIGGAFLVARGVLGVLAAAGWHISSLLDTFVVVLVFGVGTDYTIFLISRYREEVRRGDWHDASRRTVGRIGAVISASAATVMVGLGAMAFGDYEMIRSTGPALAVAIFVTLVAGLTLAPALLGIFGHYLFWPLHARTGADEAPDGFFARLANVVTHHPGVVTVVVVLALLVPAAFLPQLRTNFDTLAELPTTSDARLGYDEVAAHLGSGTIVQSTGLVQTGAQGDILAPASLARLRDTLATVASTPGVGSVTSLLTPTGDGTVPDAFRPSVELGTIAGSFSVPATSGSAGSGSGSGSGSGGSALDPAVASGLGDALDYVNALGVAFPDVAARGEFRAATSAIAEAQAIVGRAKAQSVVSTQLRTLASALTSPSAIASGTSGGTSSSDTGLVSAYLAELAAAYPEVTSLPAYDAAATAAATLKTAPTADAAITAANALDELAVQFDGRPDATLAATSLAGTPAALEAKRQATQAFAAIPTALRELATVFAGRSDDLFIPAGLGGTAAADLQRALDAFVSPDRTATRFYMTVGDDPYSTPAFTTVRTVQDELAAAAPGFGTGSVAVLDGATAQLADVQTVLQGDFLRVGVITVLGILIVLVILLRAIVAPAYLVATVLLSYASAVGLSAWLFQGPMNQPGVSFFLPLLVFVLLVALGSDYNIFLMSRVREESETRPIREGIRIASGRTGAVITSAGLILAGTFASMATAPLAVLVQAGVAVAIGVLIDTFVVRSILVPAITTLVGDRAWWPSGVRLGRGLASPAAADALAGSDVLASAEVPASTGEPRRRSPVRLAIAVGLAILVPVTFAGLLIWARPATGSPAVSAAVVNADTGATITAADGTTQPLALGARLAAALAAGRTGSTVTWTATDATAAANGLADGTYDAVLTIPPDYSRTLAAVRADTTGATSPPALGLETGDASGATTQDVARALAAAVSADATQGATASSVDDLLLAVSVARGGLAAGATSMDDLATRAGTIATDAAAAGTVAEGVAGGLGTVVESTSTATDGATKLAAGTAALADGTTSVADGATAVAGGAKSAATGASDVAGGASALARGLATLTSQTAALPAQVSKLDSGAKALASGAAKAASGAATLSSGLATLRTQTASLPAQTASLNSGAASLASGAKTLSSGAAQAASGAKTLSGSAAQLATGVHDYTAAVTQLAAGCTAMGGSAAVCQALDGIAAQSGGLVAGANGVAGGAAQVASGTAQVASGAADLATGAASLHDGTTALAAAAPKLTAGISQAASGAASLASGTAAVSKGATTLAAGTSQLAAGMPSLASGIATASTGATDLATGATTLSTGVAKLATGSADLAAGARKTASGAADLAAATKDSAAGARTLNDGLARLLDGAKLVAADTSRLAASGSALASDTTTAAAALDAAAGATAGVPATSRAAVAAQIAAPVSVRAITAGGTTPTGLAPYLAALALWLGALAALVVLPAGRRRPVSTADATGTAGAAGAEDATPEPKPWTAPLTAFAEAAALGLVASAVMVGGLLLAGLAVARLPELFAISALAAVVFVAIVQALVVAFGRRGWLLGLLFAGLQVAASGLVWPVDALPAPLAFLHPLLPLSWASDALATAIGGGPTALGPAIAVLVAWLVGALAVTLLVAARARRTGPTGGAAPRRHTPEGAAA